MDSILSLLKNTISQPPTSERSYSHHLQWNYVVDEFWNRVCLCVLATFDAAVVQWPGGLSSCHFHCSSCVPGGAPSSHWASVSFSVREEILLKFFPLSRLIANPWFSSQVTGRCEFRGAILIPPSPEESHLTRLTRWRACHHLGTWIPPSPAEPW